MAWKNKLNNIDAPFLENILSRHFRGIKCSIQGFNLQSLPGGFDAEITDGGLYLFELNGQVGKKPAPSLVLKIVPSFKSGKRAVINKLHKLSHSDLADILGEYPSNHIGEREVMSYRYFSTEIPLRMPILYYSEFDPITEIAWLFLEDLRPYQFFSSNNPAWTKERLKNVLCQMAGFHAVFWGKTKKLANKDWLGRWWVEQKSDYVSNRIAKYMVDACKRLHPTILTKKRYRLLENAIQVRPKLHKRFTQEPQTVIHWDFNPSNLCFDQSAKTNRQLIIFDWQTASIGLPLWDIVQLLMPCLEATRVKLINSLIEKYIDFLPQNIQSTIDTKEFYRLFDLVVLDHFFRVCWPILFSGKKIEDDSPYFIEWKNILTWIENYSSKWLSES